MQSILGLLLCLTLATTLEASTLERAEAAYSAGRFDEATELYLERTLDRATTAPNASVFHNLGLSFDRQKELGLAVAAYLRAVQLQPRQGDFQYNLHFLLGQTQDKLSAEFHKDFLTLIWAGPSSLLSERELYYLSVVTLLVFAILFSLSVLKSTSRRSLGTAAGVFGLLFLALLVSLNFKIDGEPDLGAVSVPKLSAYSGPAETVVIFELHSGAPFQIINSSGDWVKIELSDQKQGWVKKEGIASFGRDVVILPSHLSKKS